MRSDCSRIASYCDAFSLICATYAISDGFTAESVLQFRVQCLCKTVLLEVPSATNCLVYTSWISQNIGPSGFQRGPCEGGRTRVHNAVHGGHAAAVSGDDRDATTSEVSALNFISRSATGSLRCLRHRKEAFCMIRHKSDSQHSLATLSLGTRVYSRSPQHAVASIFAAPQLQRGDLSPTRLTCVFLAATGLAEVEPWLRHGHQGRGSHWARWRFLMTCRG